MVLFLCCPGYGVLQIDYSMGRIFLLLVFHQKPQSIEIPQNWELIFLIWCATLIKRRHLLLTDALGATDRRLAEQVYDKIAAQFARLVRLFLCLSNILTKGISAPKTS